MTDIRRATIDALRATYDGDALFRPSSIDRTINCPGSVRLAARAPRTRRVTQYIAEGLAAHQVAEQALTGVRQPEEWSDRMVKVDDLNGVFVDEEMVNGIGLYLEKIAERWEPGVQQFTERKLTLSLLDPEDPILAENRGTADHVIVNHARRKLSIFDLKWGRGVMVSGSSPQLKNYALMGVLEFFLEGGWNEVETVVVQPRAANHEERYKPVQHNANELLTTFAGELIQAMEVSLKENPPLKSGTWCRWCPARAICPELRDQAMHIADDQFSNMPRHGFTAGDALGPLPDQVFVGTLEQPRPHVMNHGTVVLPGVTDLDPGEIATILDRRHLWESWITAIEQRAVAFLQVGTNIPGYKLAQRTGHRAWKDPDSVPNILRGLGLQTGAFYTDPKLRSPAQVEKLLKSAQKKELEPLVERPLGAVVLVRAESHKPAIETSSVLGPIKND